ncbi:hypothetical protein PGT21_006111 [Puccinia graminis f. sp. tritici]|uniref:NAD(P)H:quinone oxidoreductase, type IV n=2 Tax=Puccinia graminis f. sp. tritici TaxID=56615 RepID=E3L5P0_PUCGT|nr:NAD(P)H:quinone oxidoreductase, type IV [Puccinia graminis f. sp. tritici CRL 75-36-700-3]KAA1073263.1 hypothetical protein PGT21_006710 [Puccinia graminis f. sp. tritici]EFP91865.1 NAD(P)H:quinone oxidoreductase, type IV [Puccinia graminis f. sp. tritici CRL 75-36-700-3]KAA1076405.1 hypothetical protein PGT21_006111 [Puccinia graminis f. sp. tritici]KAA1132857.1 hypothetical protein PGTUg99_014164 [Puccinia graminis f. sp. tritici]KAA1135554.1 hypothetical protein PGTUg99_017925 [Puccinia 
MPAKVALLTYSMYGHVDILADSIEEGLKASGVAVSRFQFPETLAPEVLEKMHAPPKKNIPVLTDPTVLKEFDGFLFGFPTRYGRTPAQLSTFFDMTGGLWQTAGLYGKFAGIFTSVASQHGGHETTAFTTIPFFAHHGIIFVPLGYTNPNLTDNSEIMGGSAWGASTVAGGDGSRLPTAKELNIAVGQGKSFGGVVNQYVAGAGK